eukprot:4049528-Amphidinium_carterae.1
MFCRVISNCAVFSETTCEIGVFQDMYGCVLTCHGFYIQSTTIGTPTTRQARTCAWLLVLARVCDEGALHWRSLHYECHSPSWGHPLRHVVHEELIV